jgi:hypothetical protein
VGARNRHGYTPVHVGHSKLFRYTAKMRRVAAFLQWGLSDGVFGHDRLASGLEAIRREPSTRCARIAIEIAYTQGEKLSNLC